MGYSVNHQRGGFQRVNFRVIPSPLGVKALISPEEAIVKWGHVKWGQAPFFHFLTMGLDMQNLNDCGQAFFCRGLIYQARTF